MRRRTLIFGGTGSLGSKLIERLLSTGNNVAVYSRDEAKHWTKRNELSSKFSSHMNDLQFYVGDVRDAARVKDAIRQYKPNVIIMAAALKQVDTCELSPSESVMTNIVGTQNVIDAVNSLSFIERKFIEKVLFVSTDKACSPVNVYGMCKAISERIVTSQSMSGDGEIAYLAVRYGNVLESRGSIIPLFKYQAENNDHLTVTDMNMTRFLMTLDDSVDLIEHALTNGFSGETYIPKLPSMRIGDLAEIFSEMSGKPIKMIGLRPGEKMHEDLINASEAPRTRLVGMHYVISPAYTQGHYEPFTYSSGDAPMNKSQLRHHLKQLNILSKTLDEFKGLSIEEIATNRK